MQKLLSVVVLAALLSSGSSAFSAKHIIVLMMENRSFDHMLGWLKLNNTQIDGLTGQEFNYYNASDPTSKKVYVSQDGKYVDPDPCHGVDCTSTQVFGNGPLTQNPPPMSGFVQDGNKHMIGRGETVMQMFTQKTVPVISTLALEFALFDRWFASIPGPTEVNRMFANSATSYGSCTNTNMSEIAVGYPQTTIFEEVDRSSNKSWKVYFHDLASQFYFRYVRELKNLAKFHTWNEFLTDLKTGNIGDLTWLEPRYFEDFGFPASDQHPSHDVTEGEKLMKEVYENLRASPIWNDSLLIITYDEHGGFYDHHPTPMNNVPNPDGFVCPDTHPPFQFQRLGVRIPTLAISPWINKGTLVHDPNGPTVDSKFDHTSTLATIKKLWNLPKFLTKRDAWAGTFESILSQRSSPRTDCPAKLPNPPSLRKLPLEGTRPLSDLQTSFLKMASNLVPASELADMEAPTNEGEGRQYVAQIMSKLLKRPVEELLA